MASGSEAVKLPRMQGEAPRAAIGELNERSLHRALKARYAVAGSATEQAVEGFVADILIGNHIIEIHTGTFWGLKKKLRTLLPRFAITLVHPIAQDRYIVKAPEDPAAAPTRRKSPKHGSVFASFAALVSIPTLLEHPNMNLEIVMTIEEEIRIADPRRNRRRGGWTRVDRRLLEVAETYRIGAMADLFALLDGELPETFTSRDLAAAMRSNRRLGQQAAFCFREAGVCEISGKEGNALVYRRRSA